MRIIKEQKRREEKQKNEMKQVAILSFMRHTIQREENFTDPLRFEQMVNWFFYFYKNDEKKEFCFDKEKRTAFVIHYKRVMISIKDKKYD